MEEHTASLVNASKKCVWHIEPVVLFSDYLYHDQGATSLIQSVRVSPRSPRSQFYCCRVFLIAKLTTRGLPSSTFMFLTRPPTAKSAVDKTTCLRIRPLGQGDGDPEVLHSALCIAMTCPIAVYARSFVLLVVCGFRKPPRKRPRISVRVTSQAAVRSSPALACQSMGRTSEAGLDGPRTGKSTRAYFIRSGC
jgi:hypothetical protein